MKNRLIAVTLAAATLLPITALAATADSGLYRGCPKGSGQDYERCVARRDRGAAVQSFIDKTETRSQLRLRAKEYNQDLAKSLENQSIRDRARLRRQLLNKSTTDASSSVLDKRREGALKCMEISNGRLRAACLTEAAQKLRNQQR